MLVLICCTHCGYPNMVSEDCYYVEGEVQCESCEELFTQDKDREPLHVSRIYNPPKILN